MDTFANAVANLQIEVKDDSMKLNYDGRFLGAHVAYLLIYWTYWAEVLAIDENL